MFNSGKMQIKVKMRHSFTPIRLVKIKSANTRCCQECVKVGTHTVQVGVQIGVTIWESNLAILYKVEGVLSPKHSNSTSRFSKTPQKPKIRFNVISHWLSSSAQPQISHGIDKCSFTAIEKGKACRRGCAGQVPGSPRFSQPIFPDQRKKLNANQEIPKMAIIILEVPVKHQDPELLLRLKSEQITTRWLQITDGTSADQERFWEAELNQTLLRHVERCD